MTAYDLRSTPLQALICLERASLDLDTGNLPEACSLLEEAGAECVVSGRKRVAGKIFIKVARLKRRANDLNGAVKSLAAAVDAIGARGDSKLLLEAFHNLVIYLDEIGRPADALAILENLHPLYRDHGGEVLKIRREWVWGRLQVSLGQQFEGEVALWAARERFLEQGMAYDGALVGLDLAECLLRRAAPRSEVLELAREMKPVFEARGLPTETMATYMAMCHAIEPRAEVATEVLLRLITRFRLGLQKAQS